MSARHVEVVEMSGHIIDSLLLPKVLDSIMTRGAGYEIQKIHVGKRQEDPSFARIEVRADSAEILERVLAEIHSHGAIPVHTSDCKAAVADIAGAFPEGFYCTPNFRTEV